MACPISRLLTSLVSPILRLSRLLLSLGPARPTKLPLPISRRSCSRPLPTNRHSSRWAWLTLMLRIRLRSLVLSLPLKVSLAIKTLLCVLRWLINRLAIRLSYSTKRTLRTSRCRIAPSKLISNSRILPTSVFLVRPVKANWLLTAPSSRTSLGCMVQRLTQWLRCWVVRPVRWAWVSSSRVWRLV